MKIVAVIPAFNEAQTLAEVLQKVRGFVSEMIVVDDGSADATGGVARAHGACVFTHLVNRGLGASLGTGFEAARRHGADVVVTLDADGQHDPAEIPAFVQALSDGADVVIGSRLLSRGNMPRHRVIANVIGNIITFLLFSAWVTDSQSGFRAFNRRALEKIIVRSNRMEVSSEIIAETKRHGLALKEIPIRAIYTRYSLSKGQGFIVGLKTLVKLVLKRINAQ